MKANYKGLNNIELLNLLRLMVHVREADNREAILVRQGKSWIHMPCAGHEGVMVLPYVLNRNDFLYTYYRNGHLTAAKGLPRSVLAKEFLAKKTSFSKGRNLSIHIGSKEFNIFPNAGPTASQCCPAVGTAWGQKLEGSSAVTVCSIGDGSIREGEFYEAVCFAIQFKLPIIFLIEDNGYAISTPTKSMSPLHLNIFDKQLYTRIDGCNVFEMLSHSQQALIKARGGEGPSILWCEVSRLKSHSWAEDHSLYRSTAELASLTDPIVKFSQDLISMGLLDEKTFQKITEEEQIKVRNAYLEADLGDDPDSLTLKDHLYGSPTIPKPLKIQLNNEEATINNAIRVVLEEGLKTNNKLLLFGQDIEDPKGGVFGFTKNLSTRYPKRVLNAPIAEASIIGAAIGLAVKGFLPVFEIQFIDYITPGFDQIVNQLASLRWRTCGQWYCPLVIYAPYGAYLPGGGIWHSQSNDGWWSHIPGLRVAIPSTPEDVVGLFWSAFHDKDPSLILIPKHLCRIKMPTHKYKNVRFGEARVKRIGVDITIVTWGNCVALSEGAANHLVKQEISCEVIDLRTLVPTDWTTIKTSLKKTGRLIVVHEDNKTSGFGSSIIAELISHKETFELFRTHPLLLARDDVHIPYHPNLEKIVLPQEEQIIDAAVELMSYG